MRITSSALLLLFLSLSACSDGSTSVDPEAPGPATTTIVLQNVGASAYRLVGIEGTGAQGDVTSDNPAIQLTIGERFTFDNQGGASAHPLDFRNAAGQKLFGQSNQAGSLESDPEVAVSREGNRITFTLTPALAAVLSEYICAFHPSMGGSLAAAGPG